MTSNSLSLRRYNLRGGVDVNMYNTVLEPDFALEVDAENFTDEEEKEVWNRFSITAYRSKVLELAIPLLEQQLQLLPAELHTSLVPGSTSIYSPNDYSYGGDELFFTIEAQSDMPTSKMQALLDEAVRADWTAEFSSQYRICDKLGENYTVYDFCEAEGAKAS